MRLSMHELAELQGRLSGQNLEDSGSRHVELDTAHRVLLGIDPSLRATGYGVVARLPDGWKAQEHGTIRCPRDWTQSRCLGAIADFLRDLIERHGPGACVIEGLFHARNIKTALILAQARGAAVAMAGRTGVCVYELAPRRVKQAIVGYGAAGKGAVARMVQRYLQLPKLPSPDAADALAVVLAFIQSSGRYRFKRPREI